MNINEINDCLGLFNPKYSEPKIAGILKNPANEHLLKYVAKDVFGAHLFAGNIIDYPMKDFLSDINSQLEDGMPIHLWLNIPLCEYRCRYCQFPVETFSCANEQSSQRVSKWIAAIIGEAKLWLEKIPNLKDAAIGALNIFGGTPSQLPESELLKVIDFLKQNFKITDSTVSRIEGSPDSFTHDKLAFFHSNSLKRISYGVQSFDDKLIKLSGRNHTGSQSVNVLKNAHTLNFDSVSGDLIYGLLDQSVESFLSDIKRMIDLGFDTIVMTKLHLRSFKETRTAISGVKAALWEDDEYRKTLTDMGHKWPSLGQIYQMREAAAILLTQNGYYENPTMYFNKKNTETQKWKSLVIDQDKQYVEIGMGLGASSCCRNSEANITVNAENYFEMLGNGLIPIENCTAFDERGKFCKSIKMALSTLSPLLDGIFQKKFESFSLFKEPWLGLFESLQKRNLAIIGYNEKKIELTEEGKTLVEAIINTEF